MKKFLTLIALAVFPFVNANAETNFKLDAAGDVYFVTDNDKLRVSQDGIYKVGRERKFAIYNPIKGVTGINHAFLMGRVEADVCRVNVGGGMLGETMRFHIEEANVALKLFSDLWIEGGYFSPIFAGDEDYSFNAWFTGNSLTDYFGSGYESGIGLFYEIDPKKTMRVKAVNFAYERISNNTNITFFSCYEWSDAFALKDWYLAAGTMFGNENPIDESQSLRTLSALHIKGNITEKLAADLRLKFATLEDGKIDDNQESATATGYTTQLMLRYALSDKYSIGFRFAYTSDEDGIFITNDNGTSWGGENISTGYSGIDFGVIFEYRPLSNAYIRLEGNILSLSNSKDTHYANIFLVGDDMESTRLEAAISMGYNFSLLELVK